MKKASFGRAARYGAVVAIVLAAGACTMKSQEAPGITGPSEFAKSITVAAKPDVLSQDGQSQSVITVTALGANGEPLRDENMNVDIRVGGVRTNFGSLSARHITTGSDGKATFTYTAPMSPPLSLEDGTNVTIAVTPEGTDFGNSTIRIATIRVVPVGPVVPPDGLAPYFTFAPDSAQENQQVLFQACSDSARPPCAPANNPIVEYDWDFGDGHGGRGQFETHAYELAGSYTVTLEVSDQYGRTASAARQVTVGAGANPTASFVFSPSSPRIHQTVAFNASGSAAAAGRHIVSYTWDFGDGTGPRGGGSAINYTYGSVGSYNVTLVVTDDAGKSASVTVAVTVTP